MTTTQAPTGKQFTVISAVYNTAPYLDDFITSLEKQTIGIENLELIMVDDGSTDDSLSKLKRWQNERPDVVRVLHKNNGGQGSARNAGLKIASTKWVTFIDPDDFIDSTYFATVATQITQHPEATMVATNRILYFDDGRGASNTHPLRRMFAGGTQAVDIERFPEYFHGSVPAAFFYLDTIREHNISFDERISPNFEDGLFCCQYLLRVNPIIVFIKEAIYYYRKRVAATSSLQGSARDPRRFTIVPRLGYLQILKTAVALKGAAPEWLQNFVLYELSFYFSQEQRATGSVTAAVGPVADEFLGILAEIFSYIDQEVIGAYHLNSLPPQTRDFWLHGFSSDNWHTPYAWLDKLDTKQKLVRIRFRYLGPIPEHAYYSRGLKIDPVYQKVHDFELFGRPLMHEYIAWVPTRGTIRVKLGGHFVPLRSSNIGYETTTASPRLLERWLAPKHWSRLKQRPYTIARMRPAAPAWSLTDGFLPWIKAKRSQRKFRGAWVVMDRTFAADDNGERLFEYLRTKRRDINAYFTVEKGTPTYKRLRRKYGARIVGYGTKTWRNLLFHCTNMISSHCSPEQMNPIETRSLRSPDWNFIFLQHGVIKDDLSRWLNTKKIDLFITSTQGEYDSIAGDGPYVFTGKEVKLTGLPRFDRLHRLARQVPAIERNLILICPTWRDWLTLPVQRGNQRRQVIPGFWESDFMKHWYSLLTNDNLLRAADEHNMHIAFLPHPNLRDVLTDGTLPDYIEMHSIESEDVQQIFARTALLVTDYSSMAFNSGFLGIPCIYYQFDEDAFWSGDHPSRPGYFDYRQDGFGPVVTTEADALLAIAEALKLAPDSQPVYRDRMDKTFTLRDESACERVVAEIEKL